MREININNINANNYIRRKNQSKNYQRERVNNYNKKTPEERAQELVEEICDLIFNVQYIRDYLIEEYKILNHRKGFFSRMSRQEKEDLNYNIYYNKEIRELDFEIKNLMNKLDLIDPSLNFSRIVRKIYTKESNFIKFM